jgi:hypothetical protein
MLCRGAQFELVDVRFQGAGQLAVAAQPLVGAYRAITGRLGDWVGSAIEILSERGLLIPRGGLVPARKSGQMPSVEVTNDVQW